MTRPLSALRPGMSRLTLTFLSTWGDVESLGLAGIALRDLSGNPIPIDLGQVSVFPPAPGGLASLALLFDSTDLTTDPARMWSRPWSSLGPRPTLTIRWPSGIPLGSLTLWNYNASLETSFRGVHRLALALDGLTVGPSDGWLIRKAPGLASFDFGHTLDLSPGTTAAYDRALMKLGETLAAAAARGINHNAVLGQDFQAPLLPLGLHMKLILRSTFGDIYYIGLNGLALFDANGRLIRLKPGENLWAYPESINQLPDICDDPRGLDKLVDGVVGNPSDDHTWLAPFVSPTLSSSNKATLPLSALAGGPSNVIHITFARPTAVSLVRLWNYSKDPARGVAELEIYMNDYLVHQGPLAPGSRSSAHQSIVFTNDPGILEAEASHIPNLGGQGQDTLFIDESELQTIAGRPPPSPRVVPLARPQTRGKSAGGSRSLPPPRWPLSSRLS